MSDNWDFYFCHVDEHVASIFLDLGIGRDVPIADLQSAVWLQLEMRQPREDGLSGREEYDKLVEIEDALTAAVSAADGKLVYVGRCTTAGRRDFVFYAADADDAERRLSAAMVPFADYQFDVGSRPDGAWELYGEFLYPSPRDYQTILNRQVIGVLQDNGDRLEADREVAHWAYFPSPEGRNAFVAAAEGLGYRCQERRDDAEGTNPFGAVLARQHAVDHQTIDCLVIELFDLAEEHGGRYDGWETPVVRDGADADTAP